MKKILFSMGCLLLVSCSNENINRPSIHSGRKIQNLALQNVTNTPEPEEKEQISKSRVKIIGKPLKSAILSSDQRAVYKEEDESRLFAKNCTPINEFDAVAKQLAGLYKPQNFADNDAFDSYKSFISAKWTGDLCLRSPQKLKISGTLYRTSVQKYNIFGKYTNKFAFFCVFSCVFDKKAVILHAFSMERA